MSNKDDKNQSVAKKSVSARRRFIKQSVAAGVALGSTTLAAPFVFAKKTEQQVVVRGLGGAYQEAMENALYKPFTDATGIKVVVQPATSAQIRAMVEAGRVKVDVVDLGDSGIVPLDRFGALAPIDYDGMKFTNPDDIQPTVRRRNIVGNLYFATVMVYNTEVYKPGTQPRSWAEFWDLNKFPGARTLADQKSGAAELEFALLADGVPIDKIYPVDLDRAFTSLDRVKKSVVKWWDTGAVSAQLLERKEAVLGGIWNGRAQALIDKGAPLAIEWNEAKQQVQYLSVVKNAPNAANAQRFIDFALQPQVQAELTRHIAYGPTNTKAFDFVKPEDLPKLPSAPEYYAKSFELDAEWWTDNLATVGERWQAWVLRRS